MRLLFIAPKLQSRSEIRNFSGVWSWYLPQELERRGVSVRFDHPLHLTGMSDEEMVAHYRSIDLSQIDHVLASGTRYFERVPRECAEVLMKRCRGAVVQIHDGARDNAPCHCTLTLRSDRRDTPRNYYIGWAADHKICRPAQIAGQLRILVDHADYGVGRTDHTARIIEECIAFVRSGIWKRRYSSVRLRRLVDGAIEDFGVASEVRPYGRHAISFENVCAEYSKTHVFLVTHPESVGLSVLETAMSGALPVSPVSFIRKDRLATVRHLIYDGAIPWGEVLNKIDIAASREEAIKNNWAAVSARALLYFKHFEERYIR